jgi:hypothetical protein
MLGSLSYLNCTVVDLGCPNDTFPPPAETLPHPIPFFVTSTSSTLLNGATDQLACFSGHIVQWQVVDLVLERHQIQVYLLWLCKAIKYI